MENRKLKDMTVEELKIYIDKYEFLLKEAKETIIQKDESFDTWLKYSNKEHFNWLIQKSDSKILRDLLVDENDCWDKYSTITLDEVLDMIEDDYRDDPEYIELVKKELQKVNFGSMTYDW